MLSCFGGGLLGYISRGGVEQYKTVEGKGVDSKEKEIGKRIRRIQKG